jgi:hypothetical protein
MKKNIFLFALIFIILFSSLIIPVSAMHPYYVEETNIYIELPDDYTVVTLDDISEQKSQVDSQIDSPDDIEEGTTQIFAIGNNFIVSLIKLKDTPATIKNTFSKPELNVAELQELNEFYNGDEWSIYDSSKCHFLKLTIHQTEFPSTTGMYYYTIFDDDCYALSFISFNSIPSPSQKQEAKEIVDTLNFNPDEVFLSENLYKETVTVNSSLSEDENELLSSENKYSESEGKEEAVTDTVISNNLSSASNDISEENHTFSLFSNIIKIVIAILILFSLILLFSVLKNKSRY